MSNSTADSYHKCPRCGSENLIRQVGDDEPTCHYGRLKCGDCGKHIQWLSDPAIDIIWRERVCVIDEILRCFPNKISKWEKEFLISIKSQRRLSEKQQEYFNSAGLKTLGKTICTTGEDYELVFTIPKENPAYDARGSCDYERVN